MSGIHLQILGEEVFLERYYGEPYRQYTRTVPRYVSVF